MRRLCTLALLAAVIAGCDSTDRACTLIGCTTAFAVHLDASGPVPDGTYTVTAATAADTEACTFQVAGDRVDVRSETCSAYPFEGDVFVQLPPLEGRVTVSVARQGATNAFMDQTADLVYEPQFPNGRDCGAACELARVTINIDGL